MPDDNDSDRKNPEMNEAYYEELACQEELYLEETEEELRAILIAEVSSTTRSSCMHTMEVTYLELEHAAENLITGDNDDPPLSDDAVTKLLKRA